MTKRELIDKEEVKDVLGDTINSEDDYRHALRLLDGLSTTTEQEIVKPYLDKIIEHLGKMIAENMEVDGNTLIPNQYAYCYQDIIEYTNNLLSESENKK